MVKRHKRRKEDPDVLAHHLCPSSLENRRLLLGEEWGMWGPDMPLWVSQPSLVVRVDIWYFEGSFSGLGHKSWEEQFCWKGICLPGESWVPRRLIWQCSGARALGLKTYSAPTHGVALGKLVTCLRFRFLTSKLRVMETTSHGFGKDYSCMQHVLHRGDTNAC